MKFQFVIKMVVAAFMCLSVNILAYTKPIFEIDGMPIDVAETDFLRKHPTAYLMHSDLGSNYQYFPIGASFEGYVIGVAMRGFILGKGCALGLGFQGTSPDMAIKLMMRIKNKYEKATELKPFGDNNKIMYLTNRNFFASISMDNIVGNKIVGTSHAITLKSCGLNIADKYQTIPRK